MNQVAKVFQLNRQGFNLRRGVIMAVVLGLVIIVGVLPHERRYFLTVIFAVLCLSRGRPRRDLRLPGAPAWPWSPRPVRC